ncbi:MAG: peptide chain release factor 2 [Candidatus Rifleibacteriota bacterium]
MSEFNDTVELLELTEAEGDEKTFNELLAQLDPIGRKIDRLELTTFLSEPYDASDAYLSIKPGAGGTESSDWASMLYRMYLRYIESAGFKYEVLDLQEEEQGIKSATILVKGNYAYGYLKGEKGVHRLVRISPFDSNARRHTSFSAVDVLPVLPDDIDIEIKDDDIKMDFFRSSGAGGQHVNKTSSAVRITHIPSGIVVACQIERSQHANRETALKMLKAKLYELQQEEQKKQIKNIQGEMKNIAWGSQIRSYVFCPYTMVKDLRTGEQTSDVKRVMDGDLEPFIKAYLKWHANGEKPLKISEDE